ncbi:MAG: cytochrome c biogenesis protein CcsA [Aquabacterium sp.]|uniref:cytochrome C assembly family protein n=1 Tax=Aquabacterium sp. TaxID=1872578 RepID=UPI002718D870|nr:cytochrome c biogenesis protein CcsA [Aquabacterium sp.]MDO9005876.1 cytochrome c biogenesis protein CcsA [Aquabacterium sp.]
MILSPASLTFWPSAIAVLAYGLASVLPEGEGQTVAARNRRVWAALALAWLAHAVSIVLDTFSWNSAHPAARFGFAPALSVTTWLVLAVYAVESHRLGLPAVRRALAWLAAATVALSWAFPGQEHPGSGSPWAPLHWISGFASYGLIGAALMHAALMRVAEKQLRARPGSPSAKPISLATPQALGMPLLRLESLTLRFVAAGFAMLTLTLVLGIWSSNPWHWDHKSVFSVLSWLVFAILLVGRYQFGWRGRQAVRWLYAGSTLLLLAYVGSRFVMEVVLHRPAIV